MVPNLGTKYVPNFGTYSGTKNGNGFGSKFGYLPRYPNLEPNPFQFWVPESVPKFETKSVPVFDTSDCTLGELRYGNLEWLALPYVRGLGVACTALNMGECGGLRCPKYDGVASSPPNHHFPHPPPACALRAPTGSPNARHPHSRVRPRAQLLVAAARRRCGACGCYQLWNAGIRVCVTSVWSQTCALRVATSAPHARHPHSRVRPRAQLLVAAAWRKCGTSGGSQIWNARIGVCVTLVWSQT